MFLHAYHHRKRLRIDAAALCLGQLAVRNASSVFAAGQIFILSAAAIVLSFVRKMRHFRGSVVS